MYRVSLARNVTQRPYAQRPYWRHGGVHYRQTSSSTDPSKKKKPIIRKHPVHAQPDYDQTLINEPREGKEKKIRILWCKSPLVEPEPRKLARLSPRPSITGIREAAVQASRHAGSPTQRWLSLFSFQGSVIPRHLSYHEFPAGDFVGVEAQVEILSNEVEESLRTGYVSHQAPRRNRTKGEKRQVEAVLKTPIPPLADYVSPDMLDMIRKSPFATRDEEVVFRCHDRQTRGQNLLECYRLLSRFIRNVANEIMYREQRIAAEEMIYRHEGAFDDPETVFLSEAESKAIAWNLRKPFNFYLKALRKQATKEKTAAASLPFEEDEEF